MPTIDIPDKVCSHCGNTKWFARLNKNKIPYYTCYKKKSERDKLYINNNREHFRKLYRKNSKKYNKTEKFKIWSRQYQNNMTKNLSDRYVKSLIVKDENLSFKDIPQDLVELKREQLRLFRDIRNIHSASESTEIRSV